MDMLDSLPMEAHAFGYSATLAAVLFAAIGLWRIRVGAGPPSLSFPMQGHPPCPPDTPRVGPAVVSTPRAVPSPSFHVEGGGAGTPKARFTAYFHVEKEDDEDEHRRRRLGSFDIPKAYAFYGDNRELRVIPTFQNTLTARKRRMRDVVSYSCPYNTERDLGWYRAQDLSALDGSVVRLWDGGLCK